MALGEYNSIFITYELQPVDYRFKDSSEPLFITFNLNNQELVTLLLLNMMILPRTLNCL